MFCLHVTSPLMESPFNWDDEPLPYFFEMLPIGHNFNKRLMYPLFFFFLFLYACSHHTD